MTRLQVFSIAVLSLVAAFGAYQFLYGSASENDRARWGPICEKWISDEFADGGTAKVAEAWKKPGHIVFLVLAQRPGELSRSSEAWPCVVERATGRMSKPSVFDNSWHRGL